MVINSYYLTWLTIGHCNWLAIHHLVTAQAMKRLHQQSRNIKKSIQQSMNYYYFVLLIIFTSTSRPIELPGAAIANMFNEGLIHIISNY